MQTVKTALKKIIPSNLLLMYHYLLASFAAVYYGYPSKRMIVIGVTGTKGKTSTVNFIWSCLTAGGFKTGIISTANIRIGNDESLNKYHMTMPGRFAIQRLLREMAREGCRVSVVETTSEGVKQSRHIGIYYDIAVFTNLSPEHLTSHDGSFEIYKQMKGKMFAALKSHKKFIDGNEVEKVIIANADSEHANYFLKFRADKKITYAIESKADFTACDIKEYDDGVIFSVLGKSFKVSILGKFNVYNALPAIVINRLFKVDDFKTARGLSELQTIPGRMEQIDEGQNFTVLVDYAHERLSITNVLNTANAMAGSDAKVIILLGAEGGGRDKKKRPVMGELAAVRADYVIASNVDPYEDNPTEIVEEIARASEKAGKVRGQNLFVIEDRREGIKKALSLSRKGDIVLITGKGAEQSMIIGGKSIPWDDRKVVREELKALR